MNGEASSVLLRVHPPRKPSHLSSALSFTGSEVTVPSHQTQIPETQNPVLKEKAREDGIIPVVTGHGSPHGFVSTAPGSALSALSWDLSEMKFQLHDWVRNCRVEPGCLGTPFRDLTHPVLFHPQKKVIAFRCQLV